MNARSTRRPARVVGMVALAVCVAAWAGCTADNPLYGRPDAGVAGMGDLSTHPELADLATPLDLAFPIPDLTVPLVRDLSVPPDLVPVYDLVGATCGVASRPCCNGACLAPGTICQFGICQSCGNAN